MKKVSWIDGVGGKIDVTMEMLWLLLIFVLPLLFFPNIFTTFELAKVVVFKGGVILLMLLWILKYFIKGTSPQFYAKNFRTVWAALGCFLFFYLLTTMFSVAPALSFFGWYPRFQGLQMLFFYLVFGMIVFFELRSPGQKERLIGDLSIGLVAVCGIALLQKFLPGFLQWWSDADFNARIYGTMANPNYLASYIVMVEPLLVGNLFRGRYRIFSGAAAVLGIFTLLFTLSRAGFLALFVALLFFCGVIAYRAKSRKTLFALAVIPLVAGGFVWYIMSQSQENWVKNIPFAERLFVTEESSSSARSRLEMWPAALRQIGASPFIGFGPETFAVTFPSFAPATVNTQEDHGEIPDHAHNELLDLAVQIGIPGTFAYLCFIFGMIVFCVKRFLSAQKKDDEGWLLLALASGILGLFVANQFGFSVTVHYVLLTIFSAIILNNLHHKDFQTVSCNLHTLWKGVLFITLGSLSIGMFWLQDFNTVLADIHMRQGYEASASADFQKTADEYEIAQLLAPTQPFYAVNFSYTQLQRLFEEEKLAATAIVQAYNSALHAARLRGYDSFSVSIAQELKKGF